MIGSGCGAPCGVLWGSYLLCVGVVIGLLTAIFMFSDLLYSGLLICCGITFKMQYAAADGIGAAAGVFNWGRGGISESKISTNRAG